MRRALRFLVLLGGLIALLAGTTAGSALASSSKSGFFVFKDFRSSGVIEFRDASGRLVWSTASVGDKGDPGTACGDSRHTMVGAGARWRVFPSYFVNVTSVPAEIAAGSALEDIQAGHGAWEDPWTTDCSNVPGPSPYQSFFGGLTGLPASLVADLSFDGVNAVEFRSLDGTLCEGAVACVIGFSKSGTFVEADMAFESELSGLGGDFQWTTGDTTSFTSSGGTFAVIDVATHEWGHFAGLGHVKSSPALTMFPAIRDGMQALGLGDMKGLRARY